MGCGGKINRRDFDLADRKIIVAFLAKRVQRFFCLDTARNVLIGIRIPVIILLDILILYIINIYFTYDIFRGILSR